MNPLRALMLVLVSVISLLFTEQVRSQVVTGIEVVSYSAGTGTSLNDSSAALGLPSATVDGPFGNFGELNPFNPHYSADEIVQIGSGGELTLRLTNYVTLDDSSGVLELGVLENVFLIDAGGGTNNNPASSFGADSAVLEVSDDGVNFFSLGLQEFNQAGNYWSDSPGEGLAGTTVADFGKPFEAALGDFDGLSFSDTLAEFNGSGGGTWFDVPTSLGITEIGWIRFSGVTTGTLEVDSVFGNSALKGAATIPEPSSLLLLLFGMSWLMLWKRK
ncbi:MAG: PEP-CTERM sorting domain-containing protein [Verrucomicrobiota bacterium]